MLNEVKQAISLLESKENCTIRLNHGLTSGWALINVDNLYYSLEISQQRMTYVVTKQCPVSLFGLKFISLGEIEGSEPFYSHTWQTNDPSKIALSLNLGISPIWLCLVMINERTAKGIYIKKCLDKETNKTIDIDKWFQTEWTMESECDLKSPLHHTLTTDEWIIFHANRTGKTISCNVNMIWDLHPVMGTVLRVSKWQPCTVSFDALVTFTNKQVKRETEKELGRECFNTWWMQMSKHEIREMCSPFRLIR